MKSTIALIAAALIAAPALAWGDREQGAVMGMLGTLIFQHVQRDVQGAQQPQIIHAPQPQIIYAPAPIYQPPQVVIQHQTIACPPGLAAFYIPRSDRWGRPYYLFDGCR